MSIGDSYSTEECPPSSGQYTVIQLEGQTVSNCAGGFEDGDSPNNGALITVGGLGDDFYNPAAGGQDDEKYNIAQFIPNGDTMLDLTFANPSDDDSVFVLAVGITMPTSLPGRLADTIVAHLGIKLEDRQNLLETVNAAERLEKVLGHMRAEIEILEVERRIRPVADAARARCPLDARRRELFAPLPDARDELYALPGSRQPAPIRYLRRQQKKQTGNYLRPIPR